MNKIKEVIQAKGLTVSGTAKKARMSRSHFYDIIKGNKNPTMNVAVRIARATGSTLDELFPISKTDSEARH